MSINQHSIVLSVDSIPKEIRNDPRYADKDWWLTEAREFTRSKTIQLIWDFPTNETEPHHEWQLKDGVWQFVGTFS